MQAPAYTENASVPMPNAEFARLASEGRIATTIAALTANGMAAEVVESRAEARSRVLDMLPQGAEIFTALSVTLETLGLTEVFNTSSHYSTVRSRLNGLDRGSREARQLMASPEYVIGSVHAITEQGHVLIASGSGSQLASYVYGASHVIWVVGTQKIVHDLDEGFRRIWEYSYPREYERMNALYGRGSYPAKILQINYEQPGRISVVLVKEALGF